MSQPWLGSKHLPKIPITLRLERPIVTHRRSWQGQWWRNYGWYWQCQLCDTQGGPSHLNRTFNHTLALGRMHIRNNHEGVPTTPDERFPRRIQGYSQAL